MGNARGRRTLNKKRRSPDREFADQVDNPRAAGQLYDTIHYWRLPSERLRTAKKKWFGFFFFFFFFFRAEWQACGNRAFFTQPMFEKDIQISGPGGLRLRM